MLTEIKPEAKTGIAAEGVKQQAVDDLIVNAVRRFPEAHSPELMEHYIWQDVEWGLHGKD